VCWQLSCEFKKEAYAFIDRSGAKKDFRFCGQIMDSAASAPANLAEGFAAFRHRESARYARIAVSSLTESQNHLLDGVDRGHWGRDDIKELLSLAGRAIGATLRWIAYLNRTDTPPSF